VHEPATKWLAKGQTGLPWEISTPRGPRRQRGGGPRALPHGKEASPEGEISEVCGAWSSEGKGRRPKAKATDPRGGEGTPRRDPGSPAGRSQPQGRVGGHQRVTATAATAYLWRRGPAHWTSHGAARPHGASHGVPQADYWGHTTSRGRKEEKSGKRWDCVGLDVCVDDCVWAGCVGVTLNSSEDSVPPSFGGGLLLFPRRQKATGGRGFPFFLPHPSERRIIGLSNARVFPKTLYQGLSLRCLRGCRKSPPRAVMRPWPAASPTIVACPDRLRPRLPEGSPQRLS
jgi:hypothetical protein